MVYASTFQQSTGRARPGAAIGRAVTSLFLHHEAGAPLAASATLAQERARVKAIDSFHRSLGWLGFGYNAMAAPSGRLHEGRGYGRAGSHTSGHNTTGHGLLVPGNNPTLTGPQIDAIRRWGAEGKRNGAVAQAARWRGHRDVGSTACPGGRPYAALPQINAAAGTPAPAPSQPNHTGGLGSRQLRLTSPMMRGADVLELQRLVNVWLRATGRPTIAEDSVLGTDTLGAVAELLGVLGHATIRDPATLVVGPQTVTWVRAAATPAPVTPAPAPPPPDPFEEFWMALTPQQQSVLENMDREDLLALAGIARVVAARAKENKIGALHQGQSWAAALGDVIDAQKRRDLGLEEMNSTELGATRASVGFARIVRPVLAALGVTSSHERVPENRPYTLAELRADPDVPSLLEDLDAFGGVDLDGDGLEGVDET